MKKYVAAILDIFSMSDNTWLYLNLNDMHVIESPHSERALQLVPFVRASGKRRMTTFEIVTTLINAAQDPNVKGLILAFNESIIEHRTVLGQQIDSHLGMGALEEISRAIEYFRLHKHQQRFGSIDDFFVPVPNSSNSQDDIKHLLEKHVVVAIADNYGICLQRRRKLTLRIS